MTHVHDWRIALMEAHPRLFHPRAGHSGRPSGYAWCEQGWQDLLERMCERMETALREGETIRIVQIKEKFATVRCYWRGDVSPETSAAIVEAVALAEARSACTCEECGAEGRLYNDRGYYMTRCAEHARGAEVPPDGRANIRLVRRTPGTNDVRHMRYDRATDSFIKVDEEE